MTSGFGSVYSQIDSTAREYFPTQIGNYWEYQTFAVPPDPSPLTGVTIVGDTVLPNGLPYKILEYRDISPPGPDGFREYWRYDLGTLRALSSHEKKKVP